VSSANAVTAIAGIINASSIRCSLIAENRKGTKLNINNKTSKYIFIAA